MFKVLILLGSLLMPVGLVFAFGLPALIGCAMLALLTAMCSMGGPSSAHPNAGDTAMGTTFLAGL